MKIDVAVKFIIVLLVIMIVSLSVALIILNNDDGEKETKPAVTTKAPLTTKPDTTPEETTTPETTTTPKTTEKPDTTEPDQVDPPVVPDGLSVEKSFRSNTGVSLNLRADVKAFEKNGKAYIRVDVYLEHYSINANPRKGTIVIGDEKFSFVTGSLIDSSTQKTETLLVSKEAEVGYGEVVDIKVDLESNITYGGKMLEHIVAEGTVTVK